MLAINQGNQRERKGEQGFTLIELSIVLVIIGLIVGGVLVGQDLIRAAEIRATISQIERYNTAVNTFRGKYNAIPGDMNLATATTFGFPTTNRTSTGACGLANGDGILTDQVCDAAAGYVNQGGGETGYFWVDISSSVAGSLIDAGFSTATLVGTPTVSGTGLAQYFPAAKLGRGNMIYVYEQAGLNYYGMSDISNLSSGSMTSTGSLAPIQAYNIDKKMDDGVANTGNVQANFLGIGAATVADTADPISAADFNSGNASPASAYTATTCYDTSSGLYVTAYNNGQGASCGLSFKFQ